MTTHYKTRVNKVLAGSDEKFLDAYGNRSGLMIASLSGNAQTAYIRFNAPGDTTVPTATNFDMFIEKGERLVFTGLGTPQNEVWIAGNAGDRIAVLDDNPGGSSSSGY